MYVALYHWEISEETPSLVKIDVQATFFIF